MRNTIAREHASDHQVALGANDDFRWLRKDEKLARSEASSENFERYFAKHYPLIAQYFSTLPPSIQGLIPRDGDVTDHYWPRNLLPSSTISAEERDKQCWTLNVRTLLLHKLELESTMKAEFKSKFIFKPSDFRMIKRSLKLKFWERALWNRRWCGTRRGCWWTTPQQNRPSDEYLGIIVNERALKYKFFEIVVDELRKEAPEMRMALLRPVRWPLTVLRDYVAHNCDYAQGLNFTYLLLTKGPKMMYRAFFDELKRARRRWNKGHFYLKADLWWSSMLPQGSHMNELPTATGQRELPACSPEHEVRWGKCPAEHYNGCDTVWGVVPGSEVTGKL